MEEISRKVLKKPVDQIELFAQSLRQPISGQIWE